ncbi:MFS transporter [Nocardioides anomalus]|uniref:MFS transporter n=1 Tax=Nocardioides anomalus TaxID=2712223 RepID=A0A6G6WHN5_9ACTN|nr:MFS transporter [Nocardioides anomalus]QIG44605.1 MFS transporter [Nocardioides anomalus]
MTHAATDRGLIACLSFAALTGAIVAGLGSPIVYEVAVTRDVTVADAQWGLIVTLVVGAVCTPVLSRLADGRLRRHLLVGSLLVVTAASLVALVPTFSALLTARSLQGFGYAMVPLTVSIAREQLEGAVLARTLGVLSTSVAVGVGLGNPAIGLCVLLGGYRLAFLLAAVVAGSAALWVWRRVPVSTGGGAVAVDLPGALLLWLGLAATLLAIARGSVWGWTSTPVLGLGASGVVLLVAWSVLELRVPAPLIDLRLATAPGVLAVNVAALLLGVGIFGGVSVVVLVAQSPTATGFGLGYSVLVYGLLMLPMALASLVCPGLARVLARRIGFRAVLTLGSVMVAASFGVFALRHAGPVDVLLMMLLLGVGIGLAYSVMPALIVARTPDERTASATGVNQVLRLLGGAFGAALVATVLAAYTPVGEDGPRETGIVVASLVSCTGALVSAGVAWLLLPRRTVVSATVDSHFTAE